MRPFFNYIFPVGKRMTMIVSSLTLGTEWGGGLFHFWSTWNQGYV